MTKAELLEIIKDYPDEVDLVFTQETERQAGDVSDMYLDHLTECKAFNYINLYFKWSKPKNGNDFISDVSGSFSFEDMANFAVWIKDNFSDEIAGAFARRSDGNLYWDEQVADLVKLWYENYHEQEENGLFGKSVCPACGSKYYDEDNNVKRCQDCYTIF